MFGSDIFNGLETNKVFWGIVIAFCIVIILLIVYIPAIIAYMRNHYNKLAILMLNIFLGWSFIGWVICLVWSVTKSKDNTTKENNEKDAINESLDGMNDGNS